MDNGSVKSGTETIVATGDQTDRGLPAVTALSSGGWVVTLSLIHI